MPSAEIILSIFLGLAALLILLGIFGIQQQNRTQAKTQRLLTDRDLLLLFTSEPDGFLTPKSLADRSRLSKRQARTRLQKLMTAGIVDRTQNQRMVNFYSLRNPLATTEMLTLSPDPFLTVEDILTAFEAYDFRPRDQDLVMATGLSLNVIQREMKYFVEEGVVDRISQSSGYGKRDQRMYVLKEPYRSRPDQFRQRAGADDLKLENLLRNDNLII